ncbi:PucR family transcriptional regulator [Eubacteriaceae bacterium ES2]|nr:PucR family transcriptional regulator [Eubacteriaceae bacterium ES2]
MSIPISELYLSTKKQYQLTLIAGPNGLFNQVEWVQFTEDINTVNFLKGGELIITTGMSRNSNQWLFDFVKKLISQKTSGLILNTGKYIFPEDINEDLLNLCNTHHYPIFTMPWKIHLATIMQDYGNRLFKQNYQDDQVEMAFRSLILQPDEATQHIEVLNRHSFENNSNYFIFLHKNHASFLIQFELFQSAHIKFFSFTIGDQNVVVTSDLSNQILEKLFREIDQSCQDIFIGISSEGSLLKLHDLYYQAQFALKSAIKSHQSYVSFHKLGVTAILYSVADKSLLSNFYEQKLQILKNHDEKNNSDLLETFRLYLEHDGSIQAIAQASYAHRNTINYRIKKIRQLLSANLLTMEEKFNFRLAFIIREYLFLESQAD